MDGNFQLKRLKSKSSVNEANTGIFSPSPDQQRLWGNDEEVEKFSREAEINKDEDVSIFINYLRLKVDSITILYQCLVQNIMDNNFKAASNNKRKLNQRYAENGVFSMGCARHGVPDRLYDIKGGEGYVDLIIIPQYCIRIIVNYFIGLNMLSHV